MNTMINFIQHSPAPYSTHQLHTALTSSIQHSPAPYSTHQLQYSTHQLHTALTSSNTALTSSIQHSPVQYVCAHVSIVVTICLPVTQWNWHQHLHMSLVAMLLMLWCTVCMTSYCSYSLSPTALSYYTGWWGHRHRSVSARMHTHAHTHIHTDRHTNMHTRTDTQVHTAMYVSTSSLLLPPSPSFTGTCSAHLEFGCRQQLWRWRSIGQKTFHKVSVLVHGGVMRMGHIAEPHCSKEQYFVDFSYEGESYVCIQIWCSPTCSGYIPTYVGQICTLLTLVMPSQRVQVFPDETHTVPAGNLFCSVCREKLSLKQVNIKNHIELSKHVRSKDALQ